MDVAKFFEGLQTTLTDALKGAPEGEPAAPEAPTLESVAKAVEELQAAAKPPEGDPEPPAPAATEEPKGDTVDLVALTKSVADAVTGVIAPLKETLDTHGEALEKALDRIAKLEGGTAVRKSATVDEAPGDGEPVVKAPEPKEALFKAVDAAIKGMKPVTFA